MKKWKKEKKRKLTKFEKYRMERDEIALQIQFRLNPGNSTQTGGKKCDSLSVFCSLNCSGCSNNVVSDIPEQETLEKLREVETWRQKKP